MSRLLLLALSTLLIGCSFSSEYAPLSKDVAVGTSEELIVATDCGLDQMVFDIDASLWVPTDMQEVDLHGAPQGFAPDNDVGTITLISEDEAEYRSSYGRTITLTRIPGNFVVRSSEC